MKWNKEPRAYPCLHIHILSQQQYNEKFIEIKTELINSSRWLSRDSCFGEAGASGGVKLLRTVQIQCNKLKGVWQWHNEWKRWEKMMI